jgi:MtN3 and saliva related transmembrane protein
MSHITMVGILASSFTSFSLIPQVLKLLREKDGKNISIIMLAVLFTGLCFWIYYGTLKDDLIIIFSNSFAAVVNVTTAVLAIKYNRSARRLQS